MERLGCGLWMGRKEELGEIVPGRGMELLKMEGISADSSPMSPMGVGLTVLGRGGRETGVNDDLRAGEVVMGKGEGMRKREPNGSELVKGGNVGTCEPQERPLG